MKRNAADPWRTAAMTVVVVLAALGTVWNVGIGSLSGFGIGQISGVCPLGFLETVLADHSFLPRSLVSFLVIAGITAIFGRILCGWVCPIPLLRHWLPGGKQNKNEPRHGNGDANGSRKSEDNEPNPEVERARPALYLLGGTLLSSAIFGFPVFCLICPIGLFFFTVFGVLRLFRYNEPSLDLIAIPVILLVELVLLKKWCSRLCPLGALLGLFATFHRGLVPTVDPARCLVETRGSRCHQCHSVCAFGVDLKKSPPEGRLNECVKCRDCAAICPAKAISFPWWRS